MGKKKLYEDSKIDCLIKDTIDKLYIQISIYITNQTGIFEESNVWFRCTNWFHSENTQKQQGQMLSVTNVRNTFFDLVKKHQENKKLQTLDNILT